MTISTIHNKLDYLIKNNADKQLRHINRGLEKESLRVAAGGNLAQTSHPIALGSALTHPNITTDYSESLLELVTSVHTDVETLLSHLENIHQFTYQHINDEKLWTNSMPCIIEGEDKIPIARYGTSNIAKMKEVYRHGLSHRYGSLMQAISGIHFNLSLSEDYWRTTADSDSTEQIQQYKSTSYFALIRNFHRYSWMCHYLFGASPAVCQTFLQNRSHSLQQFNDGSYYLPYATSLRMSGLGYSSESQTDIAINYNNLDEFVTSLRRAITLNHSPYNKIGIKKNDLYQQLNSNFLQIENEFYSTIRPKRVAPSGVSPSRILKEKGVEYIEIRSIDLNPFCHTGIDQHTIRFLDLFLLYCLYTDSPYMSQEEYQLTQTNQQTITTNGRDINSQINNLEGKPHPARQLMQQIMSEIQPIAELMDDVHQSTAYSESVNLQIEKIRHPENTPSAKILDTMQTNNMSFYEFSMLMSEKTEQYFKHRHLDADIDKQFQQHAKESIKKQQQIEEQDNMNFDDYLEQYFTRQNAPLN